MILILFLGLIIVCKFILSILMLVLSCLCRHSSKSLRINANNVCTGMLGDEARNGLSSHVIAKKDETQ